MKCFWNCSVFFFIFCLIVCSSVEISGMVEICLKVRWHFYGAYRMCVIFIDEAIRRRKKKVKNLLLPSSAFVTLFSFCHKPKKKKNEWILVSCAWWRARTSKRLSKYIMSRFISDSLMHFVAPFSCNSP